MELTDAELRTLYFGIVQPTAASNPPHPDPIGYMARAVALSGGDPDYIDVLGNVGFMPVSPDDAFDQVESSDVQTLEGNIISTLLMDIKLFSRLGNIEDMIVAFHEGETEALAGTPTQDMKDLLAAMPQLRVDMNELLFPRPATVKDVVRFISDSMEPSDIPEYQRVFFKRLLNNE